MTLPDQVADRFSPLRRGRVTGFIADVAPYAPGPETPLPRDADQDRSRDSGQDRSRDSGQEGLSPGSGGSDRNSVDTSADARADAADAAGGETDNGSNDGEWNDGGPLSPRAAAGADGSVALRVVVRSGAVSRRTRSHVFVAPGARIEELLAEVHSHPSLPYKVDTSRPSLRTNWTRLVPFPQEDRIKLWVDHQLLIDQWTSLGPANGVGLAPTLTPTGTFYFQVAETFYDVKVLARLLSCSQLPTSACGPTAPEQPPGRSLCFRVHPAHPACRH